MRAPWALASVVYLLLALALTWPLALSLGSALPGYPNVDALDTVGLRGLFLRLIADPAALPMTDGVYFPVGYPALWLMPNVVDHLLGAPFAALLSFPLSDNLFWLVVLTGNGLAGHRLGQQLGGDHRAGFVVGVAWAVAEPTLREVNLHHAPQSIAWFAPLYLGAMWRVFTAGRLQDGAWAGLWIALAGLTYWYNAIFLAIGTAAFAAWGLSTTPAARRPFLFAVLVACLVALPGMAPWLTHLDALPLADPSVSPAPLNMREALEPVPEALRFVVEHSGAPADLLRAAPLDRSNRVSWPLLALALWGLWRGETPRGARLGLLLCALTGAVMSLGPYLKWGEDPVALGDTLIALPFRALGQLHPFFARLTWPERWGLLIPLGLAALAASSPRPLICAAVIAAEAFLLSGNAPLQTISLRGLEQWRALEAAPGAVLELPLARGGLQAPLVGLHARYHRQAIVNPTLLPPGTQAPAEWKRMIDEEPLLAYLREFEDGAYPADPGPEAVRRLRSLGVAAIAVDAMPGSMLTEGRLNRYMMGVGKHLGMPEDHGAVLIWWISPPEARPEPLGLEAGRRWRAEQARWQTDHPAPELHTLIEPTWDARRHQPF